MKLPDHIHIQCHRRTRSGDRKAWRLVQHRRYLFFFGASLFLLCKVLTLATYNDEAAHMKRRQPANQPFSNMSVIMHLVNKNPPSYQYVWQKPTRSSSVSKQSYSRPNPHLSNVDCPAMFAGNQTAVQQAKDYMYTARRSEISNQDYVERTQNCDDFKKERGYYTEPLSVEEYEFPIAYSLLMYKGVQQVERLLRAIYQPQNFYCIHIDQKAKEDVRKAMESIANCFPNVFITRQSENVVWGHISIIYAEMHCMQELLPYRWKYFLNLSGQMFPLHSNRELVKILKLYDGANDIEGTYERNRMFWLTVRQKLSWRLMTSINLVVPTIFIKSAPPHAVVIYKGSNQIAVTREFVAFFMHSPVVKDLVMFFEDTLAPDEYIWPSINHNPHLGAPGSYKGDPETKKFTARATIWSPIAHQINWSWKHWECQGQWVREICIFGVGDLPWLEERPELFANKFFEDFEWIAYDCMEDLIHKRNLEGDSRKFNSSYYEELPFVKYKKTLVNLVSSQY